MRRTVITGLLLAGPPPLPSPAIPPPARKYSRRSAASATPWRRVRTASVRRYSAWSAARPAAFQASTTPPTTRSRHHLGRRTLDKYLTNPRAMVPDTSMVYAGLKDDAEARRPGRVSSAQVPRVDLRQLLPRVARATARK